MPGFDLHEDPFFCPTERNALTEFYNSAQGSEWINNNNWTEPYVGQCDWYGVKCRNGSTIKLDLPNNGLSGTLNQNITILRALEVLDLNNNYIKVRLILEQPLIIYSFISNLSLILLQGSIPSEIGVLSNLTRIRLSYNEFTGNETNFAELRKLKLIHLHGNRLSGTILSSNAWAFDNKLSFSSDYAQKSSFISDCGNPSDFNESLICKGCTMCCEYSKHLQLDTYYL